MTKGMMSKAAKAWRKSLEKENGISDVSGMEDFFNSDPSSVK